MLFRLPGGLTLSDFVNADGVISLETGQNDVFGVAGRTLFANLDPLSEQSLFCAGFCIPEPNALWLLSTGLPVIVLLRRKRSDQM